MHAYLIWIVVQDDERRLESNTCGHSVSTMIYRLIENNFKLREPRTWVIQDRFQGDWSDRVQMHVNGETLTLTWLRGESDPQLEERAQMAWRNHRQMTRGGWTRMGGGCWIAAH